MDPDLLICSDQIRKYSIQDGTGLVSSVEGAMRLYLRICNQYLQLKQAVSSVQQKSQNAVTTDTSDRRKDSSIQYSHELVKCYAILVATAVEGMAHCDVILGKQKFETQLQEVWY